VADVKLMGASEIQARLRLSRQRTYILINRRDFPPPRWQLAMGQIWDQDDVEKWIRANRPHLDDPDEA
jgi:prophage regulatory protein